MNNITVERVINAYEAAVVIPAFEGWGNREKNCGCAITAVAIHEKSEWFPNVSEFLDNYDNHGTHEICSAVAISWPYMLGFTDAFDGCEFGTSDQEGNADVWGDRDKAEYHMGYDHGKVVRQAVTERYFQKDTKVMLDAN
ncbi:hypothetical protein [Paenibacillus taichungensis]